MGRCSEVDLELAEEVANYYADPRGFVAFAYPWGEPGVLRDATGPDPLARTDDDAGDVLRSSPLTGRLLGLSWYSRG